MNSPLWSDEAVKERFIGLPGDKTVEFQIAQSWDCSDGTVLVKTFWLPVTDRNSEALTRIETRLLTRQQGEWYGYSYAWNEERTDAILVAAPGRDRLIEVTVPRAEGGSRHQIWHFPSRAECMVCHSRAENYVLGLSIQQINRDLIINGETMPQWERFKRLGIFHRALKNDDDESHESRVHTPFTFPSSIQEMPRLPDPADKTQPLRANFMTVFGTWLVAAPPMPNREGFPRPHCRAICSKARVRSYLRSNCANCHVTAGGGNSQINLAFNKPLDETRMLNAARIHASCDMLDARLIKPSDPMASVLLHRMRHRGRGQMPPLATSVVGRDSVEMISQ